MNTFFWLTILIVCIAVEAATQGVISVWFAFGAGAAFIANYVGASEGIQWFVFAAVSLLTLVFTRPVVKKLMAFRHTATNHELDIGKTAIVIETVDNRENTGRVNLSGVEWAARSRDGDVIPKGASVLVTDMAATTLTVVTDAVPVGTAESRR